MDAKQINDFEALREDIVFQQFLTLLPAAGRAFVEARLPESPSRAAELADLYFQIVQSGSGSRNYPGRDNKDQCHKPSAGAAPPSEDRPMEQTKK